MTLSPQVWIFPAACCFLLLPYAANGQQTIRPHWQSQTPSPAYLLQSAPQHNSSPLQPAHSAPQPVLAPAQPLSAGQAQPTPFLQQPATASSQEPTPPTVQQEIPSVWPPPPAPARVPGYLGITIRDFYRQRFCMHALTIQGVEIASVAPDSPAARAGLRPARGLSAREIAAATVAGLLTISPASSLAAPVLRATGGVEHGDIILALNGRRVKTQNQFQEALARFGPHTVVHLTIRRGEATLQLPVHLEEWPTSGPFASLQQTSAQLSNR
jgi:hypothetical protein